MSRITSTVITTSLIGSGVLAWAFAGRPLLADPSLDVPLNPLGINRSPYGEVFAMAMQGPIETNFHVGMFGCADHSHSQASHSHNQAPGSLLLIKPEPESEPSAKETSLSHRLRTMLTSIEESSKERTNPKPASRALKFYLRRQAEDKLRFAYQLDPSHYGNYTALHFFLTEGVGTRPELTPTSAKLAQETIDYCLKQEHDPRPALTAAAACTNILHLMFKDWNSATPKFDTEQMRQCLNTLNHCLNRYESIAGQWDETKNWALLSPMRINECETRFSFISKIGDSAEKTILRFERETQNQQVSNEL